jgi:hypothetical protein
MRNATIENCWLLLRINIVHIVPAPFPGCCCCCCVYSRSEWMYKLYTSKMHRRCMAKLYIDDARSAKLCTY